MEDKLIKINGDLHADLKSYLKEKNLFMKEYVEYLIQDAIKNNFTYAMKSTIEKISELVQVNLSAKNSPIMKTYKLSPDYDPVNNNTLIAPFKITFDEEFKVNPNDYTYHLNDKYGSILEANNETSFTFRSKHPDIIKRDSEWLMNHIKNVLESDVILDFESDKQYLGGLNNVEVLMMGSCHVGAEAPTEKIHLIENQTKTYDDLETELLALLTGSASIEYDSSLTIDTKNKEKFTRKFITKVFGASHKLAQESRIAMANTIIIPYDFFINHLDHKQFEIHNELENDTNACLYVGLLDYMKIFISRKVKKVVMYCNSSAIETISYRLIYNFNDCDINQLNYKFYLPEGNISSIVFNICDPVIIETLNLFIDNELKKIPYLKVEKVSIPNLIKTPWSVSVPYIPHLKNINNEEIMRMFSNEILQTLIRLNSTKFEVHNKKIVVSELITMKYITDILDEVTDTDEDVYVMTNGSIAAFLNDLNGTEYDNKSLLTSIGAAYEICRIGKYIILVDPYQKYSDQRLVILGENTIRYNKYICKNIDYDSATNLVNKISGRYDHITSGVVIEIVDPNQII